jgi:hypothetical protein
LMLTMLTMLISTALAGEGFEPGEEKRLRLECTKQRNGAACLALAGETLCGRGYNDDTRSWMQQGCTNHKANCEAEKPTDCLPYAVCVATCLPTDAIEILELWEFGYPGGWGPHCHLPSPFSTDEQAAQTKEGLKLIAAAAATACKADDPLGCLLVGMAHVADKPPSTTKAKHAWQKACELKSSVGCLKLSDHLQLEAQNLRARACELGDTSVCAPTAPE